MTTKEIKELALQILNRNGETGIKKSDFTVRQAKQLIKELAEKTGYSETTLRFCTHPASKKRNKGNRLVVFAVDDE